jgi:uncharacterized membrane protein YeaQ/YmgE (transglycosylase-associated protein family)
VRPRFGARERASARGHVGLRGTPHGQTPVRHLHADEEGVVIGFLVSMLIIGIIAGFLARLLVPGRDPMGFWATVLLGIIGSFIGGFLGYVLFGKDLDEGALQPSGVVGSVIGAVIALLIYRAITSRRRSALRR